MLKKLFPLFLIALLLTMVGCEISGSGSISSDTDSIIVESLSPNTNTISVNDSLTAYFAFTASEYITQKDVNIKITNGVEDVSNDFDIRLSTFSEMKTTLQDKKSSFILKPDSKCEDGLYILTLDIILGAKKSTVSFSFKVGDTPDINITIDKPIMVAKNETDTVKATVNTIKTLTLSDFSISMVKDDPMDITPLVQVLSYTNGELRFEVESYHANEGTYRGKIFVKDYSFLFDIEITSDSNFAEIELINNASLTQGETTTTSAKIINGDWLIPSDFEVVVAGAISDNFTLKAPTAEVTHYNNSNGIATIKIDATKADAGTFSATLKVEGNEKDFTIVVKEGATVDEISIDWVDLANWLAEAGDNNIFQYTLSASEVVTEEVISVSFENSSDGSSATDYFVVTISEFEAQYTYKTMDPKSYVVVSVNSNCPAGTYVMTIMADLGAASSAQKVTILVQDVDPVEITSIENVSLDAGSTGATTALIKNGSSLTKDDFSVTVAGSGSINSNDSLPTASIASYVSGTVTIVINATFAKAGTYTGTLMTGSVEKDFTITVEQTAISLTEKSMKLYNPWAKDRFNSALNIVTGYPVAGEVSPVSGCMVYAAADSAIADIAVDNSADIRATEVVAELTSINGGKFAQISRAEYEAATTKSKIEALAEAKSFTDNEFILTQSDDISVDGYVVMKLANSRGYAVVQMAELNTTATEGSTGNTGYLKINYRFTAL